MPAPLRPNTAPATAARLAKASKRRLETMAAKLRDAGWFVVPPEQVADLPPEVLNAAPNPSKEHHPS